MKVDTLLASIFDFVVAMDFLIDSSSIFVSFGEHTKSFEQSVPYAGQGCGCSLSLPSPLQGTGATRRLESLSWPIIELRLRLMLGRL